MRKTGVHLPDLPDVVVNDITRAGYYPALVSDVLATALGQEQIVSHLVHAETTFDREHIHRHVSVLALTATRLLIVHADDHHAPEEESGAAADGLDAGIAGAMATATSESVPLSAVRGVMLTHVVADPANYQPGRLGREVTVTVGWGTVSRVDLLPAICPDPSCEADHGFEGTITGDDIALRISADADGEQVFDQALSFAGALSRALGR